MQPYMIGQEETGRYTPAFDKAIADIIHTPWEQIVSLAGVSWEARLSAFMFESLGQCVHITLPAGRVSFANRPEVPLLDWRLVLLHYLGKADGVPLSGELKHFRAMPGGNAYESAFQKRGPALLTSLCRCPVAQWNAVCQALGGVITQGSADVQAVFSLAPRFPITLQVWLGDEEMEGAASILFDARADHYLPTEDMAVAASLLARFIRKQYTLMFPQEYR